MINGAWLPTVDAVMNSQPGHLKTPLLMWCKLTGKLKGSRVLDYWKDLVGYLNASRQSSCTNMAPKGRKREIQNVSCCTYKYVEHTKLKQ